MCRNVFIKPLTHELLKNGEIKLYDWGKARWFECFIAINFIYERCKEDWLIDLAKIGLGIAFVPDYCITKETNDLYIVQTKEKMPTRQIVVSVNTTLPVSASTEEFLKLLPEVTN